MKYIVSLKHAQKFRVSFAVFIEYVPFVAPRYVVHHIPHCALRLIGVLGVQMTCLGKEESEADLLERKTRNVGKELLSQYHEEKQLKCNSPFHVSKRFLLSSHNIICWNPCPIWCQRI